MQHGVHGDGVRNKQGEMILEFRCTINITVGNTLFKKRGSHLVTYESEPSKTSVPRRKVWILIKGYVKNDFCSTISKYREGT